MYDIIGIELRCHYIFLYNMRLSLLIVLTFKPIIIIIITIR